MNGVAAPETDERGGLQATEAMREIIDGRSVRCALVGQKTYEREVGVCWIGALDIGAALIEAGYARDCPRFSGGRYAALEPPASLTLSLPGYTASADRKETTMVVVAIALGVTLALIAVQR